MASPEALQALLSCCASGELEAVALNTDTLTFPSGAVFPRSTPVAVAGVTRPVDEVLVLARSSARSSGGANLAAYVKDARAAGVATIAIGERARLLAFLSSEEAGLAPAAKRVRATPAEAPVLRSDGLLDEQAGEEVTLSSCAQLQDRNSILLSRHKTFSDVLDLLQTAVKGGAPAAAAPKPAAPVVVAPQLKSSRYKEVQEQKFWQERLGTRGDDDLGIDTNASFLANPATALPPAAVMPLIAAPAPAAQPAPAPRPARPASAAPQPPRPAPPSKSRKEGAVPIIIVPSGLGASVLVNMFNAQPFFEDCTFVPWEQRKAAGARKEAVLEVKRRWGCTKPVTYHIMDRAPPAKSPLATACFSATLTPTAQDWARVVAVFVQGALWQFKDFPHTGAAEGNLLQTFEAIQAFYVRYDSEAPPDFVKKWSVKVLDISKNARHHDSAVISKFWQALDERLTRANRTDLSYRS